MSEAIQTVETEATDNRHSSGEFQILGRWRKSVSVTKKGDGFRINRYDKKLQRWIQIMYLATVEDYDDFVNWLADVVPEDEADDDQDD